MRLRVVNNSDELLAYDLCLQATMERWSVEEASWQDIGRSLYQFPHGGSYDCDSLPNLEPGHEAETSYRLSQALEPGRYRYCGTEMQFVERSGQVRSSRQVCSNSFEIR